MSTPAQTSSKVRFGEFELNRETAELRRNGTKTILPGQPFQILATLLDRAGELVTRDELKKQLWPSDTFVDFDQSLNKAVNRLREVLEDSAERPRFIETLPRGGYRFIGVLETDPLTNSAADGNRREVSVSPSLSEDEVRGSAPVQEIHSPLNKSATNPAEQTISSVPGLPIESGGSSAADRPITFDGGHDPAPPWRRRYLLAALVALVVIAAAIAAFRWFVRPNSLDPGRLEIAKLTDSGGVTDVAISPDGHFVAYSLADRERETLWLRQVGTRSAVQIVPPGTAFHGLTFSPDGNFIYFLRSDANNPFFKNLFSIPILGGSAEKLATDVDSAASFSPNGKQFVFERCIPMRLELKLQIIDIGGTNERTLATIHNATCALFQPGLNWSPDGRTIAVSALLMSKPERWVLDIVSVKNGSTRELFSSPDEIGRPVWLHGKTLVASHYEPLNHRSQIWTISYPSGETHRLTNGLSEYRGSIDITRDQGSIAALVGTAVSNLWVGPAHNSSEAHHITATGPRMVEVVENTSGRLLTVDAEGGLWSMNLDGTEVAPFGHFHEAWSLTPCGRFVVFLSSEPGMSVLTRVDADGSHPTRLADGHLSFTACSPDGRFVYYTNFDQPQKAWRTSIDGGAPQELTRVPGGLCGRLAVSPDGNLLAYPFNGSLLNDRPGGWHLAVLPSTGGPPVRTLNVPGGIEGITWSDDGTGLQYLLTREGATNIWEQPVAGGEPKQLTHFHSGRIFEFAWSFDRQQLFLIRGEVTVDVVLINNLH